MARSEVPAERIDFWGDDLSAWYLEDVINKAGENWLLPEYVTHKRFCVQEMIAFLHGVQVGGSLVREATYRRIRSSDSVRVASYLNLFGMLRSQEGLSDETINETIEGAMRALSALLSEHKRSEMQSSDRDDAAFLVKAISRAGKIAESMAV